MKKKNLYQIPALELMKIKMHTILVSSDPGVEKQSFKPTDSSGNIIGEAKGSSAGQSNVTPSHSFDF